MERDKIIMLCLNDGSVIIVNNRMGHLGMVTEIYDSRFGTEQHPLWYYTLKVLGTSEVNVHAVEFEIHIPERDVNRVVTATPDFALNTQALCEFDVTEQQRLRGLDSANGLMRRAGL